MFFSRLPGGSPGPNAQVGWIGLLFVLFVSLVGSALFLRLLLHVADFIESAQ